MKITDRCACCHEHTITRASPPGVGELEPAWDDMLLRKWSRDFKNPSCISACVAEASCDTSYFENILNVVREHIAMLIESSKTLERHFYILCWYIADLMCFENAHEPPVAVAIIHQDEAGLAFDCSTIAVKL